MSEDTEADRSVPARGVDDLEAEITHRREHLAATLDELVERARPQALAHSAVAGAKARARSTVVSADGGPRVARLAAVLAAAAAVIAVIVAARRRTSR